MTKINFFSKVYYLHIPGKAYLRSTGQKHVSMCFVDLLRNSDSIRNHHTNNQTEKTETLCYQGTS